MTDAPNYPRPRGLQVDALRDLAWDIRDNGQGSIPAGENYDRWLYWLHRHEGFTDWELEVKNPTATGNIIIGYKD